MEKSVKKIIVSIIAITIFVSFVPVLLEAFSMSDELDSSFGLFSIFGVAGSLFAFVSTMIAAMSGIIPIIVITTIIRALTNQKYFRSSVIKEEEGEKVRYRDVSKTELYEFNIDDIELFKKSLFKQFHDFEIAYNDLDYNEMRQLSTEQIYQNYYTGIKIDLENGQKRIIKDIKREEMYIFESYSSNVKQLVNTMIKISYITYKMDKNGNIISGDNLNRITEKFEVTFLKDFELKSVKQCPNCGAAVTGNKCEYCRESLKDVNFKISAIKRIVNN